MNNGTKVVLLVLDGLGGLPLEVGGVTELEAASTPTMDNLAARYISGLSDPILPGLTPGSGPGHLGLFGYDPLKYEIGRGVLEALGIGFQLTHNDVAARGNFCTADADGIITDRRAGRIATSECARRVDVLRQIKLPGVETFVEPVKDYRFALVLRGEGLNGEIEDTDPQQTGKKPLPVTARLPEAQKTAALVSQWCERAYALIKDMAPANSFVLRGFAKDPGLPKFPDVYKMRSAAIAVYPMYRGVARLVGMDIVVPLGETPEDEFATVAKYWDQFDFFFVHIKKTDSFGEDGNFQGKVKLMEEVDAALPKLLDLKPDVLVITGDHSTPAKLKSHSWHPLPVLLVADTVRRDMVKSFGETACLNGGLGRIQHKDLMSLILAHARRLNKFGA
jgi:2,3-bisphosphoglycerate-independent phosphoglycerate mutase